MKRLISLIILVSLIGIGLLFNEAKAQNIGTLRDVVTSGFSFKKDLRLGDTDPDVKELQRVLNADIDTMIISDADGSRGRETTYFGSLTKAAVIKFQNKYKDVVLTLNSITSADGVVNKATRTRLNLLLGVMTTYDSVGLPQSRASTASTPVSTYVAPTTIVSTTQPQMSVCSFVELLINIGAIPSDKVSLARSVLGCSASTDTNPYVILKVNGRNGPITVTPNSYVTVSWTSYGVVSCYSPNNTKPLSGSESILIGSISGNVAIACKTADGTVIGDTVKVNVGSSSSESEDTSGPTLNVSVSPSTSTATFSISTDESATYKIYYGLSSSNLTAITLSGEYTSKTYVLTSLIPGTAYYFKVSAEDEDDNKSQTSVGTFVTSSLSSVASTATSTPQILVDYVIPSINSATFNFLTDRPTTAVIHYGINHEGTTTVALTSLSTSKQKEVTGLVADENYRYRIFVTDSNGNIGSTTEKYFMTLDEIATTTDNNASASTTPPEEAGVELSFGGKVLYVSSCGAKDNPNQYSLVVVESVDGITPVVAKIDGPAEAWPRKYGGDWGMSDPTVKLVLRHAPVTGAPLPKVGECVLGTSNGEPDTCSTTTDSQASIPGLTAGSDLSKACEGVGGKFEAGGIIKDLEIASKEVCDAAMSNKTAGGPSGGGGGSSGDNNFFSKAGHTVGQVLEWTPVGWVYQGVRQVFKVIGVDLPNIRDVGEKVGDFLKNPLHLW